MKWLFLMQLFLVYSLSGCGLREREISVQRKEAELTEKERVLAEKETSLQLKEEELLIKEQLYQSRRVDTTTTHDAKLSNPALVGQWHVRMTCTETTCTGSAIGDTRTETWDFSFQDGQVIAKALSGDKLIRTYSGAFRNNLLELAENVEHSSAHPSTRMLVRLTLLNETSMEGEREIIRAGNCRIVYALQLAKQ
jgi:hypothetical protein